MKSLSKTVCVALTLWSVLPYGLPQNATPPSPPASSHTNGIVEAEIGNGDLKPGRFAQIIAVPVSLAGDMRTAIGNLADIIGKARTGASSGPAADLIEIQCVTAMLQIKPALTKLSQAAHTSPQSGVVTTDADELGEFSLTGLQKEPYVIFATGKVGMNAAIWLEDLGPSAQSDRIKLVRPQLACYDPKGLYTP